ncbi:3-deoxy-8-phosphooctulonate synthase [Crateriforma conspicua]|uniref:2-dehydro-3-deoxyphosphooctonate aldolase n=1 Tax=Crateriforma conspicua TaxID=2527996 RepID=A0A5C6FSK9_9PLAN|nr:3-deoxy-8-phosphooctulonate synthase [Crateriforma conspicua]TWU65341.1 2-dehydro-3-deoxyphosphooctonate aldolase [Crateriforma conspicua]
MNAAKNSSADSGADPGSAAQNVVVIPAANGGPAFRCGSGQPLMLIAGPCVLQDEDTSMRIAEVLAAINQSDQVNVVFKASFDKANRTSAAAKRGPGLEQGVEMLRRIGQASGLPVTTDVHLPTQCGVAAEVCSILQIPAFLARQTDLVVAAAETGRPVNVKKGQFMAPEDMRHVVAKATGAGDGGVLLCERGTFFGYGRLVNDMAGLVTMRNMGVPVVFDATHSVQRPGGLGDATGGNREMVEPLARAAVSVGIDALFFETHPQPERSPSDGPNMIPLDQFRPLIDRLLRLRQCVNELASIR